MTDTKEDSKRRMINLDLEDKVIRARRNRRPGDFEAHLQANTNPDDPRTQALRIVSAKETKT